MTNKDFFKIERLKEFSLKYLQSGSNKIAIYTSVTNNYDSLFEPKFKSDDIDYYVFTDSKKIDSNIWNIIKIDDSKSDPRKIAKVFKVLPHLFFPNYNFSIWVDGGIEIIDDLSILIKNFLVSQPIAFFNHSSRDCIYKEAEHVIGLGYENKEIVEMQMNKYLQSNYPYKNGLIAGGFIIRNHNDKNCIMVMEDWWNEIINYSIRDQLSFNYISWKTKIIYDIIKLNYFENKYFKIHPHKKIKFYGSDGSSKVRQIRSKALFYLSSSNLYRRYIRKYYLKIKKK